MDFSWLDTAVSFYLRSTAENDQSTRLLNPGCALIPQSLSWPDRSASLDHAIRAVALQNLGNKDPKFARLHVLAAHEYGRALRLQSAAINSATGSLSVDVLLTCILITRYCWRGDASDTSTILRHMNAMGRIVLLSGRAWAQEPWSARILRSIRERILVHSAATYQYLLPAEPECTWFRDFDALGMNPWDHLQQILLSIPNLRAQAMQLWRSRRKSEPPEAAALWQRAAVIRKQLEDWLFALPESWRIPKVVSVHAPDGKFPGHSVAHIFPELWHAILMNWYCLCMIWVGQAAQMHVQYRLKISPPADQADDLVELNATIQGSLQTMVNYICSNIAPLSVEDGSVFQLGKRIRALDTVFIQYMLEPVAFSLSVSKIPEWKRDWIRQRMSELTGEVHSAHIQLDSPEFSSRGPSPPPNSAGPAGWGDKLTFWNFPIPMKY